MTQSSQQLPQSEQSQLDRLALVANAFEPYTVNGPPPASTTTSPNPPLSSADDHGEQSGSHGTLMLSKGGRSKYLGPTAGSEWLKDVGNLPSIQHIELMRFSLRRKTLPKPPSSLVLPLLRHRRISTDRNQAPRHWEVLSPLPSHSTPSPPGSELASCCRSYPHEKKRGPWSNHTIDIVHGSE